MISVVIPVFRDIVNALALIHTLEQQALPERMALEIIAVDDGSGDGTSEVLKRRADEVVRVVTLDRNHGRAAARNAGSAQARGKYIVFVDCDCRPLGEHFLAAHARVLASRSIASCGHVRGANDAFWSRYQQDASIRRARQHAQGIRWSGASSNIAVQADAFRKIGGFDNRYAGYGFEDRDLLLRLACAGEIGWCNDAVVQHLDSLNLPGVLAKMQAADSASAAMFSRDNPDAYRRLGYAALDARIHPWLRPVSWVTKPVLGTSRLVDRALDKPWMPYTVARTVVKLMSALAYLRGTTAR